MKESLIRDKVPKSTRWDVDYEKKKLLGQNNPDDVKDPAAPVRR